MSYSSILEAIKSASEITPDKICLGDKKNKVTYKQFWKMINKGASFLEENGVKKGKDGSIDFENVSFKYREDASEYALENVNLHIQAGQTIGVIGTTGSAKTTLVQLIPRLYDATTGVVRVGGVNVRDYDLSVLRDSVNITLQKNVLFQELCVKI